MAETDDKQHGVLGGVNFATVVASALAAGTALMLSSYIGIAGSLIGTVVAAAVSSISSQVYQGIINKSADKVKDVAEAALAQTVAMAPTTRDASSVQGGDSGETSVLGLGEQAVGDFAPAADETTELSPDHTLVRPRPLGVDGEPAGSGQEGSTSAPVAATPIASDELIQAAHEHESRDMRKRILIVTIAAALVALALTAVAIYAFTAGQGIGEKPTFAAVRAVEEQAADDATTTDQGEATDDAASDEDATQADDATGSAETTEPTEDTQPATTEPSADADTTTDSPTTEPTADEPATSVTTGDSTDSTEGDTATPAE